MTRPTHILLLLLVMLIAAAATYGVMSLQSDPPPQPKPVQQNVVAETPVVPTEPKKPAKPVYTDVTFTFEYPTNYKVSPWTIINPVKNVASLFVYKVDNKGQAIGTPTVTVMRSNATMTDEIKKLSSGWTVESLENIPETCGIGKKLVRSTYAELYQTTVIDTRFLYENNGQLIVISGYEDLDWTDLFPLATSFTFTDCN